MCQLGGGHLEQVQNEALIEGLGRQPLGHGEDSVEVVDQVQVYVDSLLNAFEPGFKDII